MAILAIAIDPRLGKDSTIFGVEAPAFQQNDQPDARSCNEQLKQEDGDLRWGYQGDAEDGEARQQKAVQDAWVWVFHSYHLGLSKDSLG